MSSAVRNAVQEAGFIQPTSRWESKHAKAFHIDALLEIYAALQDGVDQHRNAVDPREVQRISRGILRPMLTAVKDPREYSQSELWDAF